MSASYYITNKKKLKEYQAFQEFWDNRFIPGIMDSIREYCEGAAGEYINQSTARDICDEISFGLPSCPISIDDSSMRIGTFSRISGFLWDWADIEGTVISSVADMVSFLSAHPECSLQDENWRDISVEEFRKRIDCEK